MVPLHYIGIDPDTNATGIAIWTPGAAQPWELRSIEVAKGDIDKRLVEMGRKLASALQGYRSEVVRVVAVEWPMIYPRIRARPNDILAIATVAGAAVAAGELADAVKILLPRPQAWKGTVPKEIAQARYLKEAGLTLDHPAFQNIKPKFRTHVADAIGLALWARKQEGCTA